MGPVMDLKPVRFAVIGYGNIGSRHVAFLKDMEGAKLVRVCDIINARADEGAKITGGGCTPAYSFDEVLEDDDVEVVNLCTPSGLHASQAVQAMESGKNVLSEKPMALSLGEADRIIECEERTGMRYMLVKQNRYNPPVAILKDLIEGGRLGRIYMVSSTVLWNRNENYFREGTWRGTLDLDGGSLFTQCSHFVDLVLWMGGRPVSVNAKMANVSHPYIEVEDLGMVRIEFENGALGLLNYTTATYGKNMEGSITVMGEKGCVKVGGKYLNEVSEWNVDGIERPEIPPGAPPNTYKGGYQGSMSNHDKVLKNVIGVLSKGEDIAVKSDQGRLSVEVMQAAHISDVFDRTVHLPLKGADLSFDTRKRKPFGKHWSKQP
jgi:UDP-N-acetyl-2-amino-2-deoxyglucuronate dehydrogenase